MTIVSRERTHVSLKVLIKQIVDGCPMINKYTYETVEYLCSSILGQTEHVSFASCVNEKTANFQKRLTYLKIFSNAFIDAVLSARNIKRKLMTMHGPTQM